MKCNCLVEINSIQFKKKKLIYKGLQFSLFMMYSHYISLTIVSSHIIVMCVLNSIFGLIFRRASRQRSGHQQI